MSIIGVTQSFLHAKRETLDRLLRAYVEGVAMMVHDKERAVKILAKYLRRSDAEFIDETYTLVRTYTERIPRFDSRAIAVLLEFDQVKGVTADVLTARVIDNSIVDQLVEEKFMKKFLARNFARVR
jgi:ABC-type nitrate/sulfonate/bicarbonate transport system substrate-binding protein